MTDEKPKRRSRTKLVLYILLLLVVAAAVAWIFGPREPADTTVTFNPASIGSDVDAWIAKREDGVENLRETARKEIIWAFPNSKAKTPLALVYLHGFSAAKGEIRPVPDMVAEELGANLYYTRLTGHGRDGAAMAQASVNAWIQDAAEAVAVGERIGEKVVLIANSTGGSLAALAASLPQLADRIDGIVFISPNFKVRAAGSQILTMPYAKYAVRVVIGAERGFTPINEEQAEHWTEQYPSQAVLPMAAMVKKAREVNFEQIDIPALFIYHPDDTIVDQSVTAEVARRWGGRSESLRVEDSSDPANHVIAGDILSPGNNTIVAKAITAFANQLGK